MGYLRGLGRPWQGLKDKGCLEIRSYSVVFKELGALWWWDTSEVPQAGFGVPGTFHGWFFRMELQDFLMHFNTVQICSLSPEVLGPSPAGGGWHIHTFQGRWVRGFNSGGSQPSAGEAWGPLRSTLGGLWQGGNSTTFLLFRQKTSGPIPSSG